jgi:hypothetical protein
MQIDAVKFKGRDKTHYAYGRPAKFSFEEFCTIPAVATDNKWVNEGYVFGKLDNNHRSDSNLHERQWLVFDIDGCPDAELFDSAYDAFEIAGIKANIYTTWSHRPKENNNRIRIVVPLSRSITKKEHEDVYFNTIDRIPYLKHLHSKGYVDDTMKSWSQLCIAPSYHPDHELEFRRQSTGGSPLIPDTRFNSSSKKVSSSVVAVNGAGKNRNVNLTSFCGKLLNEFKDIDVVRSKLHKLNQEIYPDDPLPYEEVNTIVDSICKSHERNNPEDLIVKDALTVIEKIAQREINSPFAIKKLAGRLEVEPPPRIWIIEDFIPAGIVGGYMAQGGTGKSFLLLDTCIAVATGTSFLNRFPVPTPRPVCYISAEDKEDEIIRRMYYICQQYDKEFRDKVDQNFYFIDIVGRGGKLLKKDKHGNFEVTDAVEQLTQNLVKDIGEDIGLLVFDPISKFRDADENDNNAGTRFVETIEGIAREFNECSAWVSHHFNKNGNSNVQFQQAGRGASSVVDAMRQVYNMSAMSVEEQQNLFESDPSQDGQMLELHWAKGNYTAKFHKPIYLKKLEHGVLIPEDKAQGEYLIPRILQKIIDYPMTKSKFRDNYSGRHNEFGLAQKRLTEKLDELHEQKLIIIQDYGDMLVTSKGKAVVQNSVKQ